MNILFCGSEIKGNFIAEISRRKKDKVSFTGSHNHIKDYEDEIFKTTNDVIVFDVSDLLDDSDEIVEYISRVRSAKSSHIIVVATGFTYKSRVITDLINAGFKNFILAVGLASQNEEYEKCITGYYEENGIDECIATEEKELEEERKKENSYTTIGVCGTLDRIGTTTQCMQIVKYILKKGYKAAYVEVNSTGYIGKCKQLYNDIVEDKEKTYVTYNSVDMYPGDEISKAFEKCDYVVCDYGSMLDPSFNKVSFTEKDLHIFVTGAKANEIETIQPVIQSTVYSGAFYLFSFVPEADKKDLLEMMCDRKEKTIFAGYCPDPFDYINNPDYEKILDLPDASGKEEKRGTTRSKFLKRLIQKA